jgi:ankyrin repeat protein
MDLPSCLKLTDHDIQRMRISGENSSENLDISMESYVFKNSYVLQGQEKNIKNANQEYFNHLVRSHNFDEALTCVKEDFLTVKNPFICPLSMAIRENDYRAVSFLLSTLKMKYNQEHYMQVSTKKMAKLLMKKGITHEDKNNLNVKLITTSQAESFIAYVARQIANINMWLDENKNTLLHKAVKDGSTNVVEALLQHPGIEIGKRDISDFTPFDYAITTKKKNIISLFNKIGVFFRPAELGNPFALLDSKENADVLSEKENFVAELFLSMKHRDEKQRVPFFDEGRRGISIDSQGFYFSEASFKDLECWIGKEVIESIDKHLLSRCLKVLAAMNEPSNHYFQGWVRNFDCPQGRYTDHNTITKLVIQYPFVLFYDAKIAFKILLVGLKHKNQEAFKYIIENLNPDLSLVDEDGNTLLHHAVILKSWFSGFLIKNGINFFARNKDGKTALDSAQGHHQEECVIKMMQAFGQRCIESSEYAQKNIKRYVKEGYQMCELKYIPLLHAVYENQIIQPLLHEAARHNVELCRILLKAGASIEAKNSQGKTALQCVIEDARDSYLDKYAQSICLLLHYGAHVTEEMIMMQSTYKDKDMRAMLVNAWKKQEEERMAPPCCICFEIDVKLSAIKCTNKHGELMCDECSGQIKECPFCRQPLQ